MVSIIEPNIQIGLYNTWIFSSIYLVLNFGLVILFPKYNIVRFVKTKKIKYITIINYVLYYSFFIFSIFIPLKLGTLMFYIGIGIFIAGILLYFASMFSFAVSEYDKPVTNRMYKFSRHPIYISFFITLIGISISGVSFVLLLIAVSHFGSTVFILKEEEKECIEKYGNQYIEYKKRVRMFL